MPNSTEMGSPTPIFPPPPMRRPVRRLSHPDNRAWLVGNQANYSPPNFHRIHGPAIEYDDGEKVWYKHGYYVRAEYIPHVRDH